MIHNIVIDSRDRESGSSNNFSITLPHIVENVKKVKVNHISIPYTWYNINSTNNTLIIDEGGNQTITLSNGNYNINELVVALQAALDAIGGSITYTVSFNTISMKVTISGDNTFGINFLDSSSSMHMILGFENINYSGSSSYTSVNVVDLLPVKYVAIQIPQIGLYGHTSGSNNCKYTFLVNVDENRANLLDFTSERDYNQCLFSVPRVDWKHR